MPLCAPPLPPPAPPPVASYACLPVGVAGCAIWMLLLVLASTPFHTVYAFCSPVALSAHAAWYLCPCALSSSRLFQSPQRAQYP